MKDRKPSFMLLEPHFSGHHGAYLQWIIRGGLNRGYRALLATSRNQASHPLFPVLRETFNSDLEIAFLPDELSAHESDAATLPAMVARDYRTHVAFERFYRDTCRDDRPAFVFLPYLDHCMYSLALRGSPFGDTPWGGIAMRPAFHLSSMGVHTPGTHLSWIKERMFCRLLQSPMLAALCVIDPSLERYVKARHPALSAKCQYLPDPAEMKGSWSKPAARKALGIAGDVVVILVYGVMNSRKGLDALLKAALETGFPANGHVILAGRQDADAQALLTSPQAQALISAGRLHPINAYLTGDEEYQVFAASDLMWMGYRHHYNMSGVMVQAGQMGLPLIGSDEGMIGWLIKSKQLGITVSIHDPRQVADAIGQFVLDTEHARCCGANGRQSFASHTPELFAKLILDRMENVKP